MFGSKKQTLVVEGMMCEHCAAHVKQALEALPEVKGAKVNLAEKTVEVKVSADISSETYAKAITDAGYKFVEVK